MKSLLPFLLMLTATACRKEAQTNRRAAVPVRTSVPAKSAPRSSSTRRLPPILKTDRITVTIGGGYAIKIPTSVAEVDAILEDLQKLPPSRVRDQVTASIIGRLAEIDSAAARERLEAWDHALISEWLDAARAIAKILAKEDAESGLAFIETAVPAAARADVWQWFLSEIPPTDRPAYLARIPESAAKLRLGANLALVWVGSDPAACAAWMDDFAAGKNEDELRTLGNPSWVTPDTNRESQPWLDAFRAAKGAEARRLFARTAWETTKERDRPGLVAELREVIPERVKDSWENALREDPAGYAHALTEEQIAGFSPDDMRTLIRRWSEKSPQAAVEWALEHNLPEAADGLISLYYMEPEAAQELAPKLALGRNRDRAIGSLCQTLAHNNKLAEARKLLPLISDLEIREGTRREIDHDWE